MLILSRKANESVVIEIEGMDEPIEIIVTDLTANQARIGIKASAGCKIWRKELLLTMQENKEAASSPIPTDLRSVASRLGAARQGGERLESQHGDETKGTPT